MRHSVLALAALAAVAASTAHAQILPVTVEAGVSAGTLGIGPQISIHNPGSMFGARIGANFFGLSHSFSKDGVRYDADATLQNGGATFDFYPFRTGFRLSAGALINGDSATVNANPIGSISINGHSYAASDVGSLSGKATFNTFSPYVGLGYTHTLFAGLTGSIDAGAMFQGQGSLNLHATGPIASNPVFAQDLAAESKRVRDALRYAQVWPVIMITLAYRF